MDEDEELEEDNLLDTAIEKLEPYSMFKHTFYGISFCFLSCLRSLANFMPELQQTQPQLYDSLTRGLSAEEQSLIQSVVHQAEAIEQQQLATAAAAVSQQRVNGQSEHAGAVPP
jgi:hypothetical protein